MMAIIAYSGSGAGHNTPRVGVVTDEAEWDMANDGFATHVTRMSDSIASRATTPLLLRVSTKKTYQTMNAILY